MVSSKCLSARTFTAIASVFTAAAILAGCGGSQAGFAPQAVTQSNPAAATGATVMEPDNCKYAGGVRATPCRVQLNASHPVVTVTLRAPKGSKGTVVEHDTCGGASGMASISGSDASWQVTAGGTLGKCFVRFNYFNNDQKIGWARVKIENQ